MAWNGIIWPLPSKLPRVPILSTTQEIGVEPELVTSKSKSISPQHCCTRRRYNAEVLRVFLFGMMESGRDIFENIEDIPTERHILYSR